MGLLSLIQVTRSSMPEFEEYCEEIRELWDSRWLTNMGVKHQKLQKELETSLNVPHVTLFTNGHIALETAIEALEKNKIVTQKGVEYPWRKQEDVFVFQSKDIECFLQFLLKKTN